MSNHVAMSGPPAIPQDALPISFVDLGRRGGTTKPLATRTVIRYSGEVSRQENGMKPAPKPERCQGYDIDDSDDLIRPIFCSDNPALWFNGLWLCWFHLEDAGFDTHALVD